MWLLHRLPGSFWQSPRGTWAYAVALHENAAEELDGWWLGEFPSPAEALQSDMEHWDD
jgi:hypothetical protein